MRQSKSKLTFLALLASFAIVLAACSGGASAEITAAAEMQTDDGSQSAEVEAEASGSAEMEAEAEATEGEDAAMAAEAEAEAETGAEVRVAPEIVPGSAALKETQAGVFDRKAGGVQVLEFFAYWCPNCKALASSIHGLENAYAGEVEFTFLDIDKPANDALKSEYGFYYQPYVLVFDAEGNIVQSWVGGGINPLEIQAAIETALGNNG